MYPLAFVGDLSVPPTAGDWKVLEGVLSQDMSALPEYLKTWRLNLGVELYTLILLTVFLMTLCALSPDACVLHQRTTCLCLPVSNQRGFVA